MGDKTVSKELTDKMRDKLAAGFAKGDRIAELEEMVEACKADAREAEAYAEELEANRLANRVAIMRLEAKLAKEVEALDEAVYLLAPDDKDMARKAGVYRIVTTLAALKGKDDE